jgi:hypothetical protein
MAGQAPGHLHLAAMNRARCRAAFHCKEQWIYNARDPHRLTKPLKARLKTILRCNMRRPGAIRNNERARKHGHFAPFHRCRHEDQVVQNIKRRPPAQPEIGAHFPEFQFTE